MLLKINVMFSISIGIIIILFLAKATFDVAALKAALFPNGVPDPNASYVCSQNVFKCDLLFNPDPTAQYLVVTTFKSWG